MKGKEVLGEFEKLFGKLSELKKIRILMIIDEERQETAQKIFEDIISTLKTNGYHLMDEEICKYCKQPHHWVVCIEDLLLGIDESGELLEKWKKYLKGDE